MRKVSVPLGGPTSPLKFCLLSFGFIPGAQRFQPIEREFDGVENVCDAQLGDALELTNIPRQ